MSVASSVFTAPRIFITASATSDAISAHAAVCQPQTSHKSLINGKIQNPVLRRPTLLDPTSHDAKIVTAMAGH